MDQAEKQSQRRSHDVTRSGGPLPLQGLVAALLVALLLGSSPGRGSDEPVPGAEQGTRRPNVVLVLADDLGWGSIGSYGANPDLVATPGMDRIVAEGMRFLDASTPSSVCSPTRYGLLTGRYPWRLTAEFRAHAFIPLLIEPGRLTIASMLEELGYSTAAVGKWHLGYGSESPVDYTKELRPGPLEVGFDYHFGVPTNHGDRTGIFVEDHRVFGLQSSEMTSGAGSNFIGMKYLGLDAPQRVDEEVMDVLTERAIDWLERQDRARPFFLYFAPVTVHRPVTPSNAVAGSSAAGPFGDWIHEQDRAVVRLLEALERLGELDETLFILTSDNGGVFEIDQDIEQTLAIERGLRVNGPFRGGKRSIYEGGLRVPLAVRWPGRVEPGTSSGVTVNLIDILATVAEAVGYELPVASEGAEDSFSFLTVLEDGSARPTRPQMVTQSFDGNYAIRWGDWKWIEGIAHDPRKGSERRQEELHPQLYDLGRDPSETDDVIDANPRVAAFLARLLDHLRGRPDSRGRTVPPNEVVSERGR